MPTAAEYVLVAMAKTSGPVTAADLADVTGVSPDTCRRAARGLADEGLLSYELVTTEHKADPHARTRTGTLVRKTFYFEYLGR